MKGTKQKSISIGERITVFFLFRKLVLSLRDGERLMEHSSVCTTLLHEPLEIHFNDLYNYNKILFPLSMIINSNKK